MSWPDDYGPADLTSADLDAMMAAPLRIEQINEAGDPVEIPGKPTGLVMVTDTGLRIPVEVRLWFTDADVHHWEPIIEGELATLLPRVVAFDAPEPLRRGHALSFRRGAEQPWHTEEWVARVLTNSRHVFTRGYRRLSGEFSHD